MNAAFLTHIDAGYGNIEGDTYSENGTLYILTYESRSAAQYTSNIVVLLAVLAKYSVKMILAYDDLHIIKLK